MDNRELPDGYYDHPVVIEHGAREAVLPLGLFVDAVPYSHVDSTIGFWLINLITGERHLFSTLRKAVCCRCGCRGWCTFHEMFRFIKWSLVALRDKVTPGGRHDYMAWETLDAKRAVNAGIALLFRCCLFFVKGDCMEYAGTFALKAWNDSVRPCYKCNATPTLYRTLLAATWRPCSISGNAPRTITIQHVIVVGFS